MFALDLGDDGGFPSAPKTYHLKARADGKPARDPSANVIAFRSRRIEDGGVERTSAEAEHPRASTRR